MDHSELFAAADSVLGRASARSLMADLALMKLNFRTAREALADGVAPRDVWEALCEELDLSESQRWVLQRDPKA